MYIYTHVCVCLIVLPHVEPLERICLREPHLIDSHVVNDPHKLKDPHLIRDPTYKTPHYQDMLKMCVNVFNI